MKKAVMILAAIVILVTAFILVGEADQAQAQESTVIYFPLAHKTSPPMRYGCFDPDPANCVYGPPPNAP